MREKGVGPVKTLILYLLGLGLTFEGASALYWHTFSSTRVFYQHYVERSEATSDWHFDEATGMIMPRPGSEHVFVGPEFTDHSWAASVPGADFGIFDDGVDPAKERIALALGDSMTAGVGALDRNRDNWVEYVERKIKNFDFINLGLAAGDPDGYFDLYEKIVEKIPHDTLVVNFYTGNDFNVQGSVDFRISGGAFIPPGVDKDKWINNVFRANYYFPGCEAMRAKPFSYRVFVELLGRIPLTASHFPRCAANHNRPPGNDVELMKYYEEHRAVLSKLNGERGADGGRQAEDIFVFQNNMAFYLTRNEYSEGYAIASAKIQAGTLNRIYGKAISAGKKFILFIHPNKGEVYFDREGAAFFHIGMGLMRRTAVPVVDFEYSRERLKEMLHKSMPVIDLTPELRVVARERDDLRLYWRVDSHYNPYGYMRVGALVCRHMREFYGDPLPADGSDPCAPDATDVARVESLARASGGF